MRLVPWFTTCVAIVALIALALVARWLRGRRYRASFRIPARRDDSFVCRGEHRTLPVSARSDGVELPAGVTGRGQTAFLVLHTDATLAGRFLDPFIEVRHGPCAYRQYFERGAAGRRLLNLSPIFQQGGAGTEIALPRIELRGRSIRWQREATLALYDPPPVENAEILVLAPHPDDAEIAAFGVYAGRRSWIATITAGEKGTADFSAVDPRGADSARWNALLRVWDSLGIPQLGGVSQERCLNLVYPDGQLEAMFQQPARPVRLACEDSLSRVTLRSRNRAPEFQGGDPACTWAGLVADLRRLLEKTKPDVVICPHPLVDGHPDHVFTTVALAEALCELSPWSPTLLLYVVHAREVSLYPFGSARGVVSVPPWTDAEWLAEAIYSHPLAPDVQRAKYFAVEAAHDERAYLDGEARTLGQAFTIVKREISALLGGTGLRASSFLRRAPRPNEIYSVVSAASLSELVKRALARDGKVRN